MATEFGMVIDGSGSTKGAADPQNTMTKWQLEGQIAKALIKANEDRKETLGSIDTQESDEITPNGTSMGGMLTVVFSDEGTLVGAGHMLSVYPDLQDEIDETTGKRITRQEIAEDHAGDLNIHNFDQLWLTVRPDGLTYIMEGINIQMEHYEEEFGEEKHKPTLCLYVQTDGALDDPQDFADFLRSNDNVVISCVVVGYGPDAQRAYRQWNTISQQHKNVHVFATNGSTDVPSIVNQLMAVVAEY